MSFNWNELLEDPLSVEDSALERVIGIGQGRIFREVAVELHALEIRELGSFLTIRIDAPVQGGTYFRAYETNVADDQGTRYATLPVGSEGASGWAGQRSVRERVRVMIVPPIPRAATRLAVTIDRIGRAEIEPSTPEGPGHAFSEPSWIDGPWRFDVRL